TFFYPSRPLTCPEVIPPFFLRAVLSRPFKIRHLGRSLPPASIEISVHMQHGKLPTLRRNRAIRDASDCLSKHFRPAPRLGSSARATSLRSRTGPTAWQRSQQTKQPTVAR